MKTTDPHTTPTLRTEMGREVNPVTAALRDAAEGARQVREDLRVAFRHSTGIATVAIERELEQIAEQTRRLKRLADAVASEESE